MYYIAIDDAGFQLTLSMLRIDVLYNTCIIVFPVGFRLTEMPITGNRKNEIFTLLCVELSDNAERYNNSPFVSNNNTGVVFCYKLTAVHVL